MKKSGILNAQLIRCIAELGHKDLFMIGDAGMPIPKGVEIVDLVVCGGVPDFFPQSHLQWCRLPLLSPLALHPSPV